MDWEDPAGTRDASETCTLQVSCDQGDRIDWGGYYEATPGTHIRANYGEAAPPTWNVDYHNDATNDDDLHVRALCVDQAAPFRP